MSNKKLTIHQKIAIIERLKSRQTIIANGLVIAKTAANVILVHSASGDVPDRMGRFRTIIELKRFLTNSQEVIVY